MAKTKKKPAPATSKKAPRSQKKLRQIPDIELGSVTGGGGLDPCNNCLRH